jgi:hypothetical protein
VTAAHQPLESAKVGILRSKLVEPLHKVLTLPFGGAIAKSHDPTEPEPAPGEIVGPDEADGVQPIFVGNLNSDAPSDSRKGVTVVRPGRSVVRVQGRSVRLGGLKGVEVAQRGSVAARQGGGFTVAQGRSVVLGRSVGLGQGSSIRLGGVEGVVVEQRGSVRW